MRMFIETCFIDRISMEYLAQILKIHHQELLSKRPELDIGTKHKAPLSLKKLYI